MQFYRLQASFELLKFDANMENAFLVLFEQTFFVHPLLDSVLFNLLVFRTCIDLSATNFETRFPSLLLNNALRMEWTVNVKYVQFEIDGVALFI